MTKAAEQAKADAEAKAAEQAKADATKQYVVALDSCSYGKRGEVIEIDGDLTGRQNVMLKPYEEPNVKKLVTAKA